MCETHLGYHSRLSLTQRASLLISAPKKCVKHNSSRVAIRRVRVAIRRVRVAIRRVCARLVGALLLNRALIQPNSPAIEP
jgi:hypothetical protein